mgnify:CR=1 FL=1
MNQLELLECCKNHELNGIRIGWSRIDIMNNNLEVFGKTTTYFTDNTAEILLYSLDEENYKSRAFLISCHCVWNSTKWFFKLKISEVSDHSKIHNSPVVEVRGRISEFLLYETDSNDNSFDYNKEEYLSDALIIKFTDKKVLSLVSCLVDDEHEPCIWIKHFMEDQLNMEKELRMGKWELREKR